MHRNARFVLTAAATTSLVLSSPGLATAATGPSSQAHTGSACPAPPQGTVRTFDGEPAGQPPADTVTRGTVVVAAAPAGTQAVHVVDSSTTSDSSVIFPATAAPARRFGIDLAPHMPLSFQLDVHGVGSTGNDVVAYRLGISPLYGWGASPAAQVSIYHATQAQPWAVIPGLTAQDAPHRMILTASPDTLVMQVGDFVFRTAVHAGSVAAVTGLEVASSGVAAKGTDLYIDRLAMTDQVDPRDLDPGIASAGLVTRLTAGTHAPVSDVATITDPAVDPRAVRAEVYVGDRWVNGAVTGTQGDLTVRAPLAEPNIGLHPVSVTVTDDHTGLCRSIQMSTQSFAPIGTSVVSQESGPEQPRFPDAVRLRDGRIVVVYHYATAHTNANGVIRLVSSSDDGRTWSKPTTVVANEYDDRDPKIVQLRDGTLLLTTFETDWTRGGANVGTFVYRSTDAGKTFPTFTKIESNVGTYEHGPAVELPNGDVLQPLYGSGARIARSTDGGNTFPADQGMTVAADNAQYTNREPNIVQLPNGELVMIIRMYFASVGAERQSRIVRSFDGGHTWTAPEWTDIPASSDHLLLTSDGSVLVSFGNIMQPLRPTYAELITNPSGPWTGYPQVPVYNSSSDDQANNSSVQLPNGSLLSFGYNIITRQVVSWRTWPNLYHRVGDGGGI
jgi:hypothetical protein